MRDEQGPGERGVLARPLAWLGQRFGFAGPPSAAGARTRRMVATTTVSSVVQVAMLVSGFIVAPLLVRHLGAVQYGIYETISSGVAWLTLAHIGLAPSVLNHLSTEESRRSPALAATTISSATAIQLAMTAGLLGLLAIAAPIVPWPQLVNAPAGIGHEVTLAVIVMLSVALVQIPLSLGRAAFEADQRGYVAQGWQLGVLAVRLSVVVIAVAAGARLSVIVIALTVPGLVGQIGMYVHAFGKSYPQWRPKRVLVSWPAGRSLLTVAGDFFVLSIATLVITATDNLVIAHVVGPGAVTPYAVTSRLTQLPTVLTLLALQAAWPAYREAATADVAWLRRTHRRMRMLALALPTLAGAVLLLVGRPLVQLWAGPEAVPSLGLLAALVAIAIVQGVLLPPGRLLTALDATRINAKVAMLNAAINLPVSLYLGRRYGVAGVAMGTVIGYAAAGWWLLVASRRRLAALEH